MKNQQGNISLYTLFLLPLVVLSTFLTIDISGWNSLRNSLQAEADTLALQAAQALPNKEIINNFIQTSIAQNKKYNLSATINYPDDYNSSLELTLTAQYLSSFNSFIKKDNFSAFSISKKSIVQIVPSDYVIILPDSNSLRPKLNSSYTIEQPWGDEEQWPASNYFNCALKPNITNSPSWKWWLNWDDNNFRRWATQSCFNPTISPLKQAAISLVDSISQNRTNRISLLFTPGEVSSLGFSVARHLRGSSTNNSIIGGFFSKNTESAQGYWGNYLEFERFLGDEVCMLFANPESALDSNYQLVSNNSPNNNCPNALDFPPCGTYHQATNHFSDCYLNQSLLLREIIYWHAAKLASADFNAKSNLIAALEQGLIELVANNEENNKIEEKAIRGNIAFSSLRKIIAFADELPDIDDENNNFTNILKQLENTNTKLTLVAFSHQGLTNEETNLLKSNYAKLKNKHPLIQYYFTENPNDLQNKFAAEIINQGKIIGIKK